MVVYHMIDTHTGEIECQGYSNNFEHNGNVIPMSMVTDYARNGKRYLGRYAFVRIGDDGVKVTRKKSDKKPKEKVNKDEMTELEKDNEISRSLGIDYGEYKMHKDTLRDLPRFKKLLEMGIV